MMSRGLLKLHFPRTISRLLSSSEAKCSFASPSTTTMSGATQTVSQQPRRLGNRVLTIETMNPHVKAMEYAVRGPIVARAAEIEKELAAGDPKPFKNVIRANIGDCHAMLQPPITYIRQVVALCTYTELFNSPLFPDDVKAQARAILDGCKGHSVGAYSDSAGVEIIRKHIAEYIKDRDGGIPSDYNNVFLSTGASDGIKSLLKLAMTGKEAVRAGVMVPIPQYPLYTATVAEYNAQLVPYYMNEEKGWSLDIDELERSINEAKPHCLPRALVVINPGNPTGQVLPRENIEAIIKFAHKHKLFIMADEVYQHNVYAEGAAFHSFKKVMTEMGGEFAEMELASFMSASKGFMGECGYRGGYCEVINLDPDVKAQLFKSISAKLCPSVSGQAVVDCIVHPPQPGSPSYDTFLQEKNKVLGDLATKAKMATKTLNSIDGVSCNEVMGAMYAFPRLHLPPKAIEAAKAKGQKPDAFYCFQLLEETGVCVVPGSGFGQKDGTYHFRMTILPPVEVLEDLLDRFKTFHVKFMQQYK